MQTSADSKQESTECEKNGRLAGAGAGVVAGARLGTILIPVPVVGTFAGAFVGGLIGSKFGKLVGGALSDGINSVKADHKPDMTAELERLGKLRDQGLLSEEEFQKAKARLLGL